MKIASELFSWFKNESIYPDVRALNTSIFIHSTPNSIIGKECCVWRSQMSFFSLFNHTFICPDVRALNATILLIQRPNLLLVSNIGYKDHKWVFLAYLITRSYVLMLERWMLPFWYIQRPTVLLIRDNVMKITNEFF